MAIMKDGHATIISFAADSDVQFEEKELTPPGVSGDGGIDVTTMRNSAWKTFSPKTLKMLTNAELTVAYDPAFLDEANSMVHVNQLITVTFPDTSTWAFWGFIDEFTPNAHVIGEQPTASLTIVPTNENASGVETAPVYSAP